MQIVEGQRVYSASDLNDYLECLHLTALERRHLDGELIKPGRSESAEFLAVKGDEHERRYLQTLRESGVPITELSSRSGSSLQEMRDAEVDTLAAMERGDALIYQPAFFDETFIGRADFLRRVENPSARWAWSYEVIDAKLARSTKAYFLIQLAAYSEHVARLQGSTPRWMHVRLGSNEDRAFLAEDYLAYYRRLKKGFLANAAAPKDDYPRERKHCKVCTWAEMCEAKRVADDYLGLVARIRNDQIVKLDAAGITTVAALARASDGARPAKMAPQSFEDLRLQAELQVRQRDAKAAGLPASQWYHYRFIPHEAQTGLALLPKPDDGDIFFDIEGDPHYDMSGLEYLFGVYLPREGEYRAFWARSGAQEKRVVEAFMDFVTERRRRYPDLRIYHYAAYEKTALRRLTGRYATRRDELDDLLRNEVFVDLFTVVRQALRISQDSYSIKKLEPFYDFNRKADLKRGDDSILMFEEWLDTRNDAILDEIQLYNDEDCRSTHHLREWLLARRAELARRDGLDIPWFQRTVVAPSEDRVAQAAENLALRDALLAGIQAPKDEIALAAMEPEIRVRYLLAHLLDYHQNDAKAEWWKFFQRCEDVDLLVDGDSEALGGLVWCADVEPYKANAKGRLLTYTYEFPEQEFYFRDDKACDPFTGAACTIEIDAEPRRVRVRLAAKIAHPAQLRALIPPFPIDTSVLADAIREVARAQLDGTLQTRLPAIVDVLAGAPPRLRDRPSGSIVQPDGDVDGHALAETIDALDRSYLFVQGPPGSGKSFNGGDAIAELLARGRRVGIMTRSHKAAHNLLHHVERAAMERGLRFDGVHCGKDPHDFESKLDRPFVRTEGNVKTALASGSQLVSGTQWAFANPDAEGAFDVLVVDEAGQLAIADVVAAARATTNLVFLGDPSQLAQVVQGSHPIGVGISVLVHLLGDHQTVPRDRGIFLPVSWRMHPDICRFVSERVYEGRLRSVEGNEANAVRAPGALHGSGLRWIPIEHSGNRRTSEEEAAAVVEAIGNLLEGSVSLRETGSRPLETDDVMVVCAYNAQRSLIEKRLREAGIHVKVGTVDTFQGQEAAVVFYSMATSGGDDLPRDMKFLFEKNRFNVAISRAQALSVLVCSPRLLEIRCKSPEQMALANLLCAYAEEAKVPNRAPSL